MTSKHQCDNIVTALVFVLKNKEPCFKTVHCDKLLDAITVFIIFSDVGFET